MRPKEGKGCFFYLKCVKEKKGHATLLQLISCCLQVWLSHNNVNVFTAFLHLMCARCQSSVMPVQVCSLFQCCRCSDPFVDSRICIFQLRCFILASPPHKLLVSGCGAFENSARSAWVCESQCAFPTNCPKF